MWLSVACLPDRIRPKDFKRSFILTSRSYVSKLSAGYDDLGELQTPPKGHQQIVF